jgi:acyl carrier protein
MDEQIVTSIIAALGRVISYEVPEITANTQLFDELGLDSSTALELLMQIEDDLGVMFETADLEMVHFQTVGTLAAFVAEHSPLLSGGAA